jgi:type I restriction enzyme S subunit
MTLIKLQDIAEISAGQSAPQGEEYFNDTGIPFIRAGNLKELTEFGDIDKVCQKISPETAKKLRLKLYPKDSILFAKSGMSCYKGYIYKTPKPTYVVSHLAIIVANSEKCLADFLKYYFAYNKPSSLIKDPAYPSISLTDIGNLSINLPSLMEQKTIVESLEKITYLIELNKQQYDKLNELFNKKKHDFFGVINVQE